MKMLFMNVDTDAAGVPVLSNDYIDDFCNDLIGRFEPSAISRLHPVNIEQLAERCLGLRLRYEHLSSDGSVLGATMFADTDTFPIYDPKRRQAVYTSAKQGTVFIEKDLMQAGKNNRCRFTLAHEAGHVLWHGMYMTSRMKARRAEPFLMCTSSSIASAAKLHKHEKLSTQALIERQANRSASALLMPREAVLKLIAPMGKCVTRDDAVDRILFTASVFRVSDSAARIRLTELGLIEPELLRSPRQHRRTA